MLNRKSEQEWYREKKENDILRLSNLMSVKSINSPDPWSAERYELKAPIVSSLIDSIEPVSSSRDVTDVLQRESLEMRWVLVLIALMAALFAAPPIAIAEDTALGELKNHLEQKAPRHWQVHVRWRDGVLLASFMPPYHEAFDLWYKPESLFEKMIDLCPERGARIWDMLTEDQDIVLEPTVGGKTAIEMRVSCRKRLVAD